MSTLTVQMGTPTPPSSGSAPPWWVDPVAATVFTIPNTIDRTGSTNVITAIQAWIDSVPNGSILEFGASGPATYQVSSSIRLNGRNNLILRPKVGATVTFQSGGWDILDSTFHFGKSGGGASHISIRGFELAGDMPGGGTMAGFHRGQESSSGCQITTGPSYIEVGNCHIRDWWGHGLYVSSSGGAAPGHIWTHDNLIERTGVMGINFGVGDFLWANDNVINDASIFPFDMEDGQAGEVLRHVYIGHNTFNRWGWNDQYTGHGVVFEGSNGMTLDDHIVEYNTFLGGHHVGGGSLSSHGDIAYDGGDTVTNLIVRNNDLSALPVLSGNPQVALDHCPGATVQHNLFPSGGSGVQSSNSPGAVLTPNP